MLQQQRILLKGSEDSIDLFTSLLKDLKGLTGGNSADVLLHAIAHWRDEDYDRVSGRLSDGPAMKSSRILFPACSAAERGAGGASACRAFHLHLLTSAEVQCRIAEELERLKRDHVLKSVLDKAGISRYAFLLEALILLLQQVYDRDGRVNGIDANYAADAELISSDIPGRADKSTSNTSPKTDRSSRTVPENEENVSNNALKGSENFLTIKLAPCDDILVLYDHKEARNAEHLLKNKGQTRQKNGDVDYAVNSRVVSNGECQKSPGKRTSCKPEPLTNGGKSSLISGKNIQPLADLSDTITTSLSEVSCTKFQSSVSNSSLARNNKQASVNSTTNNVNAGNKKYSDAQLNEEEEEAELLAKGSPKDKEPLQSLTSRSSSLPPGLEQDVESNPNRYRAVSWRQRLRQQQLEENKQLREMVRRNSKSNGSEKTSSEVATSSKASEVRNGLQRESSSSGRAASKLSNGTDYRSSVAAATTYSSEKLCNGRCSNLTETDTDTGARKAIAKTTTYSSEKLCNGRSSNLTESDTGTAAGKAIAKTSPIVSKKTTESSTLERKKSGSLSQSVESKKTAESSTLEGKKSTLNSKKKSYSSSCSSSSTSLPGRSARTGSTRSRSCYSTPSASTSSLLPTPTPTSSSTVEERRILSAHHNVDQIDNKYNTWTPVHQAAIRKLSFDKENDILSPDSSEMKRSRRHGYDLDSSLVPTLTLKERRQRASELSAYLQVMPPDCREVPGFGDKLMSSGDRLREGVDCDEVFPGIVLGNGATLKKKTYLRSIGITHVLNAAEYRGVNVGEDFFKKPGDDDQFKGYMGIRVEDTPQTQICRYFEDVYDFIDQALGDADADADADSNSNSNRVFVNCVFGKSRSTSCVIAYLMLKHAWEASRALEHVRRRRPVHVNSGFLLQIADLDHKLRWLRTET